ncbi:TPA: hypothetical protein ACJJY0_004860 [Enterobacter asburiae]
MTINERVSDERLSTLANLQSHECMALPAGHNEVAMMARELQQYRAAAEPVCPKCGGTGMADSGGFYPWGEPIFIECDCHAAPQLPQPAGLSVPEGVLKSLLPDAEKPDFWFEHNGKIFFEGVKFNNAVFEACRAAMLQDKE